ncbi:MAG: metallophosphoesterase [Bacteroidota bacterium]
MKLEIGYNHSFEVRTEQLHCKVKAPFGILFVSDLHFNAFSKKTYNTLADKIAQLNPAIILFGGDYVDTRKGLLWLSNLVATITCDYVFAIAGNHDTFFGLNKIKLAMQAGKITWLENTSATININGTTVRIDGGKPAKNAPLADLQILFTHKPIQQTSIIAKYQLVFSGHLHGCQFVFWETDKGLYPGKFFYKQNILKAQQGSCLYLVSKGMGDTLPVRYNCKKDIIFVTIT